MAHFDYALRRVLLPLTPSKGGHASSLAKEKRSGITLGIPLWRGQGEVSRARLWDKTNFTVY